MLAKDNHFILLSMLFYQLFLHAGFLKIYNQFDMKATLYFQKNIFYHWGV